MKRLSLQNRITFNYIVSTALLTGILCAIILLVFRAHTDRRYKETVNAQAARYAPALSVQDGRLVYAGDPADTDAAGVYTEIHDPAGSRIYASPNLRGRALPDADARIDLDGERVRVRRVPVETGGTEGYLLVAVADGDDEAMMTILSRICVVGFFFSMALLFIISRTIARNSIKPVREITATAASITHENLDARIPLPAHRDELYELAETINSLLDRIEGAMERERSFTSYASHEFRTPLAVLRGKMEVLARRPRTEDEYRQGIAACIGEVDRLNAMVEQLLTLTRLEAAGNALRPGEYTVAGLLAAAVAPVADAVREKNIALSTSLTPEDLSINTDEYAMSVILKNLLSNAVKYCDRGGTVTLSAHSEGRSVVIGIGNSGRIIPPGELERIFDKFYRSYASAQPDTRGFGLGLPIVGRFCTLLGIGISITSEADHGTVACLTIPL